MTSEYDAAYQAVTEFYEKHGEQCRNLIAELSEEKLALLPLETQKIISLHVKNFIAIYSTIEEIANPPLEDISNEEKRINILRPGQVMNELVASLLGDQQLPKEYPVREHYIRLISELTKSGLRNDLSNLGIRGHFHAAQQKPAPIEEKKEAENVSDALAEDAADPLIEEVKVLQSKEKTDAIVSNVAKVFVGGVVVTLVVLTLLPSSLKPLPKAPFKPKIIDVKGSYLKDGNIYPTEANVYVDEKGDGHITVGEQTRRISENDYAKLDELGYKEGKKIYIHLNGIPFPQDLEILSSRKPRDLILSISPYFAQNFDSIKISDDRNILTFIKDNGRTFPISGLKEMESIEGLKPYFKYSSNLNSETYSDIALKNSATASIQYDLDFYMAYVKSIASDLFLLTPHHAARLKEESKEPKNDIVRR